MAGDRACITNDMGDYPRKSRPFPCRVRDRHYAACPDPDTCRGCVPRDATHGYLCEQCWQRVNGALNRAVSTIVHLRSITTGGQPLEKVDRSTGQSIPIPETWQAADMLMRTLGAGDLPAACTLDDATTLATGAVDGWVRTLPSRVNTIDGARAAVVFARDMRHVMDRWQTTEAQLRSIPYVRCPSCLYPHLWRKAPAFFGDDVTVLCGTPGCDYTLNWWAWSARYVPVFEALEKDIRRREKETRRRKETP